MGFKRRVGVNSRCTWSLGVDCENRCNRKIAGRFLGSWLCDFHLRVAESERASVKHWEGLRSSLDEVKDR